MGSPDNETDREADEGPMHEVFIDSFFMSETEVTQAQWGKIMGSNPSMLQFGDSYPVENVSFNEVQQFLKSAFQKSRFGYRLPTEAEWEYACRAGSVAPYCCCPDDKTLLEYAWFGVNSGGETHPVKSFLPNQWGLYDMHGNVNEWVADGNGVIITCRSEILSVQWARIKQWQGVGVGFILLKCVEAQGGSSLKRIFEAMY